MPCILTIRWYITKYEAHILLMLTAGIIYCTGEIPPTKILIYLASHRSLTFVRRGQPRKAWAGPGKRVYRPPSIREESLHDSEYERGTEALIKPKGPSPRIPRNRVF